MKKVKFIFYGILVLFAILLVAAIFLPKEYECQTQLRLDASQPVVYNLLSNLENRAQWDPIASIEDVVFKETNSERSFSWISETIGSGRLESLLKKDTSDFTLNKYEGESKTPIVIKYSIKSDKENATIVSINYKGRQSWPLNLFNIITQKEKANLLSVELDALEIIARERERNSLYNGYTIVQDIVKEMNFIAKRSKVPSSAIQQFYVQSLGLLGNYVQDAQLEIDGVAKVLYYTEDVRAEQLDLAIAIPVIQEVHIPNAESVHLNTRKAVVVDYYGITENAYLAHNAIKAFLKDNNYVVDMPIIEEYITDITTEKDPNKWLTKITYYIVGQ